MMEGKAVLFKKFADIDGVDLELDTEDVDRFVDAVSLLGPSFGGINLEDIKSPECFIIEQRLREVMDIPVFHDDQHGTAIIAAAGLINALHLTGRDIRDIKVVSNGAGAASIACVELIKAMGVKHKNVLMCDRTGVVYQGREDGMNQWKSAHAVKTDARTLADALKGADVFLGLSAAKIMTVDMLKSMADRPIVFAMANPEPEIMPDIAKKHVLTLLLPQAGLIILIRLIMCLAFHTFSEVRLMRATAINEDMKIAAAHAIAMLAREDVPDEVTDAYAGESLRYGVDYIIPAPFDPRLISAVSSAVAKAAMSSGVARKPIDDLETYRRDLSARLDPTASFLQEVFERITPENKRVVFTEGEEEVSIRAALAFSNLGFGHPVLLGREARIKQLISDMGLDGAGDLEIINAKISNHNKEYISFLYKKLHRRGVLQRDCQRMVNHDRNVFAACMVANGHADALVTGMTRSFQASFGNVTRVIGPKKGKEFVATSMLISRGRTVFMGDTSIHERPTGEQMADIAEVIAEKALVNGACAKGRCPIFFKFW